MGGESYKRVPRGYEADHPNAPLLKRKGLYLSLDQKLPGELFDERAAAYCVERFKAMRPLVQWLEKHLSE